MEKDPGKPSSSSGRSNDRHTVQVIQQALSRQPNTAAQYLQQMYAAQQQHLMLHSAQLQSLAAQQAVSRAAPSVTTSQQTPSPMATVTSTPQVIQRPQTPGISQQAVLLGNASPPALSASQAQMYLRAQMLIFTPTATVSSTPTDTPTSQPPPISTQVQNLGARGAEAGAVNQTQLPTLAIKPTTLSLRHVTKPAGCAGGHKRGERATNNMPAYSPQPVRPRPLLPLTHQPQVSQGLSSPPITSQAPLVPESDKPKSKAAPPPQRAGIGGQDGAAQCRLLPSSSPAMLHSPNTPGTTPPVQENPQKTCQTPKSHVQPPTQRGARRAPGTPDTNNHDCEPPSRPPLDMTSGNGSSPLPASATGNTTHNGDNKPPQAVVKPQILTHVIEGFVIQEGAQPFPSLRSKAALQVGRSSVMAAAQDNTTTPPTTTTDSELEEPSRAESKSDSDPPKLKCELCGRVDLEYKFKRSKRFCSMACAKRYNVGCTKRVGLFHPDRSKLQKPPKHTRRRTRKASLTELSEDCTKQVSGPAPPSSPAPAVSQEGSSRSDNSSYEEPPSPLSASSSLPRHPGDTPTLSHNFLPSDPAKWNVEDVYEFIRSLPGCQEISEEFRLQEIDGQALLLLKEDHLMSAMNIKLGPALKIYARISMLRDS